jgi:hypothetical protein
MLLSRGRESTARRSSALLVRLRALRWLPDRRLAARYPFARVQRSQVIGIAHEAPNDAAESPAVSPSVRETVAFD